MIDTDAFLRKVPLSDHYLNGYPFILDELASDEANFQMKEISLLEKDMVSYRCNLTKLLACEIQAAASGNRSHASI